MQALLESGEIEISHERVVVEGRTVDRYLTDGGRGMPTELEIDAVGDRVLRMVEPTLVHGVEGRAITTFEYPDPATFDPTWFDPLAVGAGTTVEVEGIDRSARQVTHAVRELMIAVATYAAEWDGVIPPSLAALEPYLDRPLDWYVTTDLVSDGGPVQVQSALASLSEGAVTALDELPHDTVIFSCEFPGGRIVGHASTWVGFVPEPGQD